MQSLTALQVKPTSISLSIHFPSFLLSPKSQPPSSSTLNLSLFRLRRWAEPDGARQTETCLSPHLSPLVLSDCSLNDHRGEDRRECVLSPVKHARHEEKNLTVSSSFLTPAFYCIVWPVRCWPASLSYSVFSCLVRLTLENTERETRGAALTFPFPTHFSSHDTFIIVANGVQSCVFLWLLFLTERAVSVGEVHGRREGGTSFRLLCPSAASLSLLVIIVFPCFHVLVLMLCL